MSDGNIHQGRRERLRQRFLKQGMKGYADHEVLELLLTFALPRKDTNPIAHALVNRFGSLSGALEASYEDLQKVDGVGKHAAVLISMMLPIARCYLQSKQGDRAILSSPKACKDYARSLLFGESVEKVMLIGLDAENRVVAHCQVSSGDELEAPVSVRRVMAELLKWGANKAVICHNHPQGRAIASEDDRKLTLHLINVLQPVGIELYDHVIIAGNEAFSFRQQGEMK